MRALHACENSHPQGVLVLLRTSDCTIAVVPGGLGSTGCEGPSPFLVVTELPELVIQLERPPLKRTGVGVRFMLASLASPGACRSRPVHLIALSQSFLVDSGPLGARRQARFGW